MPGRSLPHFLRLKGNSAGIGHPANATRLRLRIERLGRDRRDGLAMQIIEELQNLLDQELLRKVDIEHLTTHYDVATVRSTLCPPALEADELAEAHLLAISQAQPLEVTSGQVLRSRPREAPR